MIVIIGRIKEQFKLENGKFVVPASLEDAYTRSPYIAQIFITGKRGIDRWEGELMMMIMMMHIYMVFMRSPYIAVCRESHSSITA